MSSILGVLFAILLSTFGISQYVAIQKSSNEHIQESITAQQHLRINEAASAYVQAYVTTIQAVATPTNPAIITVDILKNAPGKFLPESFNEENPYRQIWQAQVLQPTPGNLEMLTFATDGTNGRALNDKSVARIGALIGQVGGFIPQNDSGIYPVGNAYGAFGGWSKALTGYQNATGGRSASLLTFNNGQLASNFLYRNEVPGQPQLNRMNTKIDMNGNDVVNVNDLAAQTIETKGNVNVGDEISATGNINTDKLVSAGKLQLKDVAVEGERCASNDLVSRDSNGVILSCQSGVWKKPKGTSPGYECEHKTACSIYIPPTTSDVMLTVDYGCDANEARSIGYAIYRNSFKIKDFYVSCTKGFGLTWSATYKLSAPTSGATYSVMNAPLDPIHPGYASFFRMTAFLVN